MRLLLVSLILAAAAAVLLVAGGASATYDPVSHNQVEIHQPATATPVVGSAMLTIGGIADNDYVVPFEGDEQSPIVSDPRGDNNAAYLVVPGQDPQTPNDSSGTDVGNVWVAYDDGRQVHLKMRLYEEPYVSNEWGAVEYEVIFGHPGLAGGSATGRYKVEARQEAGNAWTGALAVEVQNPDLGALVWCKAGMPPIEVSASMRTPGYEILYVIDYADLAVDGANTTSTGVPPACSVAFGAPAQVGDVLGPWEGRAVYKAGNNPASPASPSSAIDKTDPPLGGAYPLGPAVDPYPNANTQRVTLEINGLPVGTVSVNAAGAWTRDVDMRGFPSYNCLYVIRATFQTAGVTAASGGWSVSDTTPVEDIRTHPRSDCVAEGTIQWRVPPPPDPVPDPLPAPAQTRTQADPVPVGDDHDLDGQEDGDDLCVYVHDLGRADLDGDRVGDECDLDVDGDGVPNGEDNCPRLVNNDQADTDHNGVGDECEQDTDRDGWGDLLDNCPTTVNVAQQDLDRDGVGDLCDDDVDGDGVPDGDDAFPLDRAEWRDLDGDGIGDDADTDADGDGHADAVETSLGSDPFDAASVPQDLGADADAPLPPQQAGIGAVGSIGVALVLVVLGVLLFLFARPRP